MRHSRRFLGVSEVEESLEEEGGGLERETVRTLLQEGQTGRMLVWVWGGGGGDVQRSMVVDGSYGLEN